MDEIEKIDTRNVMNLISNKLRERVVQVYQDNPDYQSLGEIELRDKLKPTMTAHRVRASFWDEYKRAQDNNVQMTIKNVYERVMTMQAFYGNFLKTDNHVAWMMCPPGEILVAMQADLWAGKDNLGKILHMDLFDEFGKLKIDEARIFIRVFDLYYNRVHGAVPHKVEQKTAIMHMDSDDAALKKELEQLRAEQGVIDVTRSK